MPRFVCLTLGGVNLDRVNWYRWDDDRKGITLYFGKEESQYVSYPESEAVFQAIMSLDPKMNEPEPWNPKDGVSV